MGVVCRSLLDQLDRLPGDARTLVGLLTFDATLHFYNFPVSHYTVAFVCDDPLPLFSLWTPSLK